MRGPVDLSREAPAAPGEEKTEKKSSSKKTVFAGLLIGALFLGGTAYAWQTSSLKSSLGKMAFTFHLSDVTDSRQEATPETSTSMEDTEEANEGTQPVTEQSALEGSSRPAPPSVSAPTPTPAPAPQSSAGVSRDESVVRRNQKTVRVQYPNGGETFCLGETFSVQWQQRGVEEVRVSFLKNAASQYEFGIFEAGGRQRVRLPKSFRLEEGLWQMVAQDAANPNVVDMSDSVFFLQRCDS